MNDILVWAVHFALCCFSMAMLFALIRLLRGPSAEDRVLALDAMYIHGMLIMITLGIGFRSSAYLDIALVIAAFGFAGSACMAKFLLRGEVIEP